jgi:hypothetical protein
MTAASTGFLHPLYAASLAELGVPRQLKRSGAWIVQRIIPGSSRLDAMGVYPLVLCRDWSGLAADLDEIREEVVCVGLVADPFGHYDDAYLRRCFPDLVLAFKDHYVVDLRRSRGEFVSPHHRHKARKASSAVRVEICSNPMALAHDWIELYGLLVHRHNMRGPLVFSPRALTTQLTVPGLVMLRAVQDGETVGAQTWYVTEDVAYGHLAAYNHRGYAASASYALYWLAIDYFAGQGLRYMDLGASPGVGKTGTDGLTIFKRGWATETRPAYFCGRIFDADGYRAICVSVGAVRGAYFPSYRQGEFG